jgi:hypothetical protein
MPVGIVDYRFVNDDKPEIREGWQSSISLVATVAKGSADLSGYITA